MTFVTSLDTCKIKPFSSVGIAFSCTRHMVHIQMNYMHWLLILSKFSTIVLCNLFNAIDNFLITNVMWDQKNNCTMHKCKLQMSIFLLLTSKKTIEKFRNHVIIGQHARTHLLFKYGNFFSFVMWWQWVIVFQKQVCTCYKSPFYLSLGCKISHKNIIIVCK
jgi:hypothetical protein